MRYTLQSHCQVGYLQWFVFFFNFIFINNAYLYYQSWWVVWNSLPKTVLSSDSVAVFKSRLKTFLFSRAVLPLLTNTLPGPSAPEVTTWWRYSNLFIIIISIIIIIKDVYINPNKRCRCPGGEGEGKWPVRCVREDQISVNLAGAADEPCSIAGSQLGANHSSIIRSITQSRHRVASRVNW